MNQEKLGNFIAQLRKENHMTQKQLAEKLNVTDRAVSNWENGRRLPDIGTIAALCKELNITVNEFFSGERIAASDFKEKAEENLLTALKNSTFSLKEKIEFYKKKWLKDHFSKIMLSTVFEIILLMILIRQKIEISLIVILICLSSFVLYILLYNQMMRYVEYNAYNKLD